MIGSVEWMYSLVVAAVGIVVVVVMTRFSELG